MAGVGPTTGIGDALDVLTVIMLEVPQQQLTKWRQAMDRADVAAKAKAGKLDRSTWGMAPHQIEQQKAALRTLEQSGR